MLGSHFKTFSLYKNLKLLYFLEFSSLSCFQPFISIYLLSLGIQPSVIGIITCMITFSSFISSPFWSNLTDRFNNQKQIVIINSIASMVSLLLLIPTGDNLIGIFILIGFYSIVSSPICPIVDTLVLKELGEDSKLYGQQRLFGAISYGIVAFITGILINHFNTGILYIIYSFWMTIFVVFYIFNQTKYGSKLKVSNSLASFKKLINDKSSEHVSDSIDIELDNNNSIVTNGGSISTSTSIPIQPRSNIITSNEIIQSNENSGENERQDELLLEQDMELEEIGSLILSSKNNSSQDLGEHAILSSDPHIEINDEANNENGNNNQILVKDGADYITVGGDEIPIDVQDLIIDGEEILSNKQVMINLVKNPQMMIFLFAIMICGMTSSIIGNFLFLFLKEHKQASNFLLGSTLPFTVVMELPFFFFGKLLLEKVGVTKMIIIGHLAYIIRLCCYNIFAIESISPWFVLPIEILHGIAFATLWGAGVELSSLMAPKGYETTYQGIFSGIYCGLGSGIGSIVGGFLYEHMSAFFLFRFTAIVTTFSLIVFTTSQLYFSNKNKNHNNAITKNGGVAVKSHF